MNYEELQIQNPELNITEIDLSEINGLNGLYIDGNIAIKRDLTSTEKACVLAEELGHHYTTVGNILDQSDVNNRKQELRARLWAYNKQIGLYGIIRAYKYRCQNLADMADYLGVTEEFLVDALNQYRMKYGCKVEVDNYVIFFEPRLAVMERFRS